ncbi:MAG TPA: rhodanese-like domain-containing protein, partial [Polyangiaceae bacterium]|nr:rhodanese-like domain-containing protein [Polyangiaceae bacterium]
MSKTYSDLFSEVKHAIQLLPLEELKTRLDRKDPLTLVDVREKDQFRQGFIPGAIHIPRGFL